MSAPHNETILETIERRLIPDEKAKKARGEVFTPLDLVREMLYGLRASSLQEGRREIWGVDTSGNLTTHPDEDRIGGIPLEIWRDPTSTWIDPANGIGNFPFVAFYMLDYQLKIHGPKEWSEEQRRKHIVEKMLYMIEIDHGNVNTTFKIMDYLVPGARPNVCCANTLSVKPDDLRKFFDIPEFTIVMGNPPFNPRGIWAKFLDWCLSKCRILTFVLPSAFTSNKTGQKIIANLKTNGLYQMRFVHTEEFPGINVDMLYLTTDKSNKDETIVINNNVEIGYGDTIVDYKPQEEERTIFRKIQALPKLTLYKGKNKTLNDKKPTETENIKFKEDTSHPHKMLSRLGGGDLEYYWVKDFVQDEKKDPKIVFPRSTGSYKSYNTLVDLSKPIVFTMPVDGDTILSSALMYLPMNSISEYEAYKFYILRSKLIRTVFLRMNHVTELTPPLFNYIPKIPVEKMTNDTDIYDAVGLTEPEREYVESIFKAGPKRRKAGTRRNRRTSLRSTR
jgi:hypothetical protein